VVPDHGDILQCSIRRHLGQHLPHLPPPSVTNNLSGSKTVSLYFCQCMFLEERRGRRNTRAQRGDQIEVVEEAHGSFYGLPFQSASFMYFKCHSHISLGVIEFQWWSFKFEHWVMPFVSLLFQNSQKRRKNGERNQSYCSWWWYNELTHGLFYCICKKYARHQLTKCPRGIY
jgi:hypothetical protein